MNTYFDTSALVGHFAIFTNEFEKLWYVLEARRLETRDPAQHRFFLDLVRNVTRIRAKGMKTEAYACTIEFERHAQFDFSHPGEVIYIPRSENYQIIFLVEDDPRILSLSA